MVLRPLFDVSTMLLLLFSEKEVVLRKLQEVNLFREKNPKSHLNKRYFACKSREQFVIMNVKRSLPAL
jgi:hypothetical protein